MVVVSGADSDCGCGDWSGSDGGGKENLNCISCLIDNLTVIPLNC